MKGALLTILLVALLVLTACAGGTPPFMATGNVVASDSTAINNDADTFEPKIEEEEEIIPSCTENFEGIIITDKDVDTVHNNECIGSSLIEYQCEDNRRGFTETVCVNGCEEAICLDKKKFDLTCKFEDGDGNKREGKCTSDNDDCYGEGSCELEFEGEFGDSITISDDCSNIRVVFLGDDKSVNFVCQTDSSEEDVEGHGTTSGIFSLSCKDSENETDYFNFGSIIVNTLENGNSITRTYDDSCSNLTLTDYYCDGNDKTNDVVNCSIGCINGACNVTLLKLSGSGGSSSQSFSTGGSGGSNTTQLPIINENITCFFRDNNVTEYGICYYGRSNCFGFDNCTIPASGASGANRTVTDNCGNSFNITIDGNDESLTFDCSGAGNGYECSDTDSGIDYDNFGTVSQNENGGLLNSYNDTCLNNSTLQEYSCDINYFKSENTTCVCSSGACIPQ